MRKGPDRIEISSRRDISAGIRHLVRIGLGGAVVVGAGSSVLALLFDGGDLFVKGALAMFGLVWVHAAWKLWPFYSGRQKFRLCFSRDGAVEGIDTDGSPISYRSVATIRYSGALLRFYDASGKKMGLAANVIAGTTALQEPLKELGYVFQPLGDDVMLPP